MIGSDPHLEQLVDEANARDRVDVHRRLPSCCARFRSWSGDVFSCVESRGHGHLHQTGATPDGEAWTPNSDLRPPADSSDLEVEDAGRARSHLALTSTAPLGHLLDRYCVSLVTCSRSRFIRSLR